MSKEKYIDGGITFVDGQYKRIVLDALGRFSHLDEPQKGPRVPSSLDIASEKAKSEMPAALTLEPTPEALALARSLTAPDPAPASGFKAPM